MELKLKIKKLQPNAVIPSYATAGDAGLDLTAVSKIPTQRYIQYGTGLAMEIPEGHVGLLFPRSSVSKVDLILANCVGVVDAPYRGEVMLRFKRHTNEMGEFIDYQIGEKVAQLIIIPRPLVIPEEVEELSDTQRGEGGFGHTGK